MIVKAEIINQPYSGHYEEKIYDISSTWNSQDWSWVKFLNEDFTEWCGQFRGSPKGVEISEKCNHILVLTSDYLFKLNSANGKLLEYESHQQYQNLTVTPSGSFLITDNYHIFLIESGLEYKELVESPLEMDVVKFAGWSNNKLLITCYEFLNWDNKVELEFDGDTLKITVKY